MSDRQEAHEMLEKLTSDQLVAVKRLLEQMTTDSFARRLAAAPLEDELISEEEEQTAAASRAWFAEHGNDAIAHEEIMAEFGLTTDQLPMPGEHGPAR